MFLVSIYSFRSKDTFRSYTEKLKSSSCSLMDFITYFLKIRSEILSTDGKGQKKDRKREKGFHKLDVLSWSCG